MLLKCSRLRKRILFVIGDHFFDGCSIPFAVRYDPNALDLYCFSCSCLITMSKMAPKTCQSSILDASDVLSHSSFCNTPGIQLRNSPNSSATVNSKWVPVERQDISFIGRPLAFEVGCPEYSLLPAVLFRPSTFPSSQCAVWSQVALFGSRL